MTGEISLREQRAPCKDVFYADRAQTLRYNTRSVAGRVTRIEGGLDALIISIERVRPVER